SEFLANMSHELRTPLNSLLILARLLADNDEATLTHRQVEYAKTICSSGHDLMALINEILDLSKIEAGKIEVKPHRVPLTLVQKYVERTFRQEARQRGLEFLVRVDPRVPSHLTTDGQRLQQILKNLLSNAFKFTPAGRVSLTVELAPRSTAYKTD